jgi:3-hydroxyisobutyrate dehydrogenase-like beta-hydroxyacid dehydrogenase
VAAPELAFIGLGGMGTAMALRLIDRGFCLSVHNRTEARTEPLRAAGARVAGTAAGAAAGAKIVIVSLSDEAAVEEIVFGALGLPAGTILIDTSTVSPGYARQAAQRLADQGVRRVETCILGNPPLARAGKARILTAGSADDVEEVRPVLKALGSQVLFVGPPGLAATMKLVFNMLLGAQVATLAEAVNYGERAGLDRDTLLSAIAQSGFSSMVMSFRAEIMRTRSYEPPAFRARLMGKDLRLATEDAAALGAAIPVLDLVHELFAGIVAAGDGDKDAAVVIEHPRPAVRPGG